MVGLGLALGLGVITEWATNQEETSGGMLCGPWWSSSRATFISQITTTTAVLDRLIDCVEERRGDEAWSSVQGRLRRERLRRRGPWCICGWSLGDAEHCLIGLPHRGFLVFSRCMQDGKDGGRSTERRTAIHRSFSAPRCKNTGASHTLKVARCPAPSANRCRSPSLPTIAALWSNRFAGEYLCLETLRNPVV